MAANDLIIYCNHEQVDRLISLTPSFPAAATAVVVVDDNTERVGVCCLLFLFYITSSTNTNLQSRRDGPGAPSSFQQGLSFSLLQSAVWLIAPERNYAILWQSSTARQRRRRLCLASLCFGLVSFETYLCRLLKGTILINNQWLCDKNGAEISDYEWIDGFRPTESSSFFFIVASESCQRSDQWMAWALVELSCHRTQCLFPFACSGCTTD